MYKQQQQQPDITIVFNKTVGSWKIFPGKYRGVEELQTLRWEDERPERCEKGTFYRYTILEVFVGHSSFQCS